MGSKNQRIKAENLLDEWAKEQIKNNDLDVTEVIYILSTKINDLAQNQLIDKLNQIKVENDNFKRLSRHLKDFYDITMSVSELKEIITDQRLLLEIRENTFTDTHISGEIAQMLSQHVLGMSYPTYGDSDEFTKKFRKLAIEKGFIKAY